MRHTAPSLLALLLVAACSKPAQQAATADTAMAPPAAAAPAPEAQTAPTAAVVVLYNAPKDTAAFEKYYAASHVPLVGANQKAIGFTRAILQRFVKNGDGSTPPKYYRKAELWFDSMDALAKGTSTPEFKKVAGDIPNFATGGFTVMIAQETK